MKEVVTIHVGQCGNGIGTQFWEMLCTDHGLDQRGVYVGNNPNELEMISVFFNETRGLHFTPRSIMIDMDKSSLETTKFTPYGKIFRDHTFLFGTGGTGNNWAKGHLSEGGELCSRSLNTIRQEVEACDCFHEFQITHSIGGGTGGGLGSLLVNKLRDEYPSRIINTYSVIPSPKVSYNVVEPYNALLTLSHMIESTHGTFCVDNEALYRIASSKLKMVDTTINGLNQIVASAMSGASGCMRFPCPVSITFRKLIVNLVPFPRMHFFITGFAPLSCKDIKPLRKFTLPEIMHDLFDYENLFADFEPKKGKFLTVICLFRGDVTLKDIDKHLSQIQNRNSANYAEWIPDNLKSAVCYVPHPVLSRTGTFIGNSTSFKVTATRIREQYLSMFKRKAFFHWFTEEGIDELEFHAADSNVNDLVAEYQEYEKTTLGESLTKFNK